MQPDGGRHGDPGNASGRRAVAGRYIAELKPIAFRQGRRQLRAGGDGVVEAELDELLADRQGDQPLHRLAGKVELAGDLVLGAPANEIEPGRPRGIVAPFVGGVAEARIISLDLAV